MKKLNLIVNDPWLAPYGEAIVGRYRYALRKEQDLTNGGVQTLSGFASGYLYFGLHRTADGWVFREWAPNATDVYLVGMFNGWQKREDFRLTRLDNGVWEIKLPEATLHHGDLYKLLVAWEGGSGERIPAWCRRVVQDERTKIFSAQVWQPEKPYCFRKKRFRPSVSPLLIYECHIGMATQDEKVGTYEEFRTQVLPRIVRSGYNAIQIMAIQEHPYYGSFGYHVSSFFAASSRFGTPDELKRLIDDAHAAGIAVIMDLVHSHAVRNEVEGLARFDGSGGQYFHTDHRREHRQWDSLCFNYGKNEVLHFLLSNCKFWLEEYRFDGFRFDGVTSMLYYSHGMGESFSSYGDYYNGHQDGDAIVYLTLANKLIHELHPRAVTIAEEVSGMPGLAAPLKDGGYGFNYRMAMNLPDFWIKTIKEQKDEDWHPSAIWRETTNRRTDERTVSYAESHDQALVGDKTLIFRLIDADMYWHMRVGDPNLRVDRGIALHKIIRLVTAATMNGAYLNFMGNEFGHPEWIDFPREGNGWSYKYARRQWHLVDNPQLKYRGLGEFDHEMISLIRGIRNFQSLPMEKILDSDGDQVLACRRGDWVFVFNFHPLRSYTGYGILTPAGMYRVMLNTDDPRFGGYGLTDDSVEHLTRYDPLHAGEKKEWLELYLPARTAVVLKRVESRTAESK
ncbi:MAG: alpha amylase C-terminal domain-containing protein [Tannerella sp.]|jgi:1,4-alpha-glucan branching enzyme|nr:alpha amylase C-terminal domain-containing protein [Tannerella sp.]